MIKIEERILDRAEIDRLIESKVEAWKASFYIPTIKAGQETKQNSIHFKNAIKELEEKLSILGETDSSLHESVKQASSLIEDIDFWQHQECGLVMFLSSDANIYIRLNFKVDNFTIISKRFYVKPLLSHTLDNTEFYILSLGKNTARLYIADAETIDEIELDNDAPSSLEDALGYELSEQQLQFHSQGASKTPIYHAQGAGEDDVKAEIRKYYSLVDPFILKKVQKNEAYLVLAGVEYLQPIYREVTKYKYLLEDGIKGSTDTVEEKDLQKQAWNKLKVKIDDERKEILNTYSLHESENRATTNLEEIILSAIDGRVDSLLLAKGEHSWGKVDYDQREVKMLNDNDNPTQELLNFAACETFKNGGKVFMLDQKQLPSNSKIAAIYRY